MKNFFVRTLLAMTLMASVNVAKSEIAVVMGTGGAPINKEKLANIYLGRSFELKPVDLPEGDNLREQFYKKATEREQAQIKAVWARIVFTGKGQPPLMLPDAVAVKKAVATDPKAIGYIDKSAVDNTVKVVMVLD
ncbi:MAG TPA: hypothetical protein VFW93_00235 [Aquabacterium sp.]|uniref:hypothetical protein n=1 Tax=Aquabacterium sp. TaxID=1872578 RepID=UPI002E355574|nr:hypothetical protein [Aquabacterium sp.]HEX5354611.1 hypothetical protein [Aquabacterium sp.]